MVPDEELGRIDDGAATAARMTGVSALLTGSSTASTVVLAAVVHAELATLHPFGSADDLVARAVEHMVLVATGVDPRASIPVEAGHAESPAAYRSALAGYASGSVRGVRGWLLHSAAALSRAAELSGVVD
jgi:Fic family protein